MSKRGVNMAVIMGHVGSDPEVRYTPSGSAVTNLSVATSESWKDKQSGENQERTEWHKIVFYNKLAEIAGQYVKKGSKVYINGSIRTRKWQDQSGADKYTTEIIANDMQMLDRKGEIDTSMGGMMSQQATKPAPQKPVSNNTVETSQAFEDDDIPF